MDLPALIQNNCAEYGLLPVESDLVVGVSGGADSVALARAFNALEIPFTIAHLNHSLRGTESDEDECFVRELAAELRVPVRTKTVNVKEQAKASGCSIEMAARQARHDFFSEFEGAVIALAHHADDQVETFILKLARGAGTEGLCGMSQVQALDHLQIIRPMLDIPRAAILQWMKEQAYAWREDSSNSNEAMLRNKVRHSILPMLRKELNPSIREAILRTMQILRSENEWMQQHEIRNLVFEPETPVAARRRAVRQWLFDQGAPEAGFEAVEKILELMQTAEGTTVYELSDHQRVVIEYGLPRFEDLQLKPSAVSWSLSIEPGTGWLRDESHVGDPCAQASVCSEKLAGRPLGVRPVQPGDRISPLGMEGSRKLQDILTDLKIPVSQRKRVPVVVCEGEIIWVPGYRIARGWEVDGSGRKSVHIKLEQNRTE